MITRGIRYLFFFVLMGMLVLGLGPTPVLSASVPPTGFTIPYSGRLTDNTGQSVPDGLYDFQFALYDTPSGGKPVWSETQLAVPVSGGTFTVLLGERKPVGAISNNAHWLAVQVRGLREFVFTALEPRQWIDEPSVTNPTVGPPCPHDHLGETWNYGASTANGLLLTGAVSWPSGLLRATNSTNGPAVWGVNNGGGNGVRGDGYGPSIGVYGEGDLGVGVAGNSSGNDGMSGGTSAADKSGVYGHAGGTSFNYGVYGTSDAGRGVHGVDGGANPDDSYALFALGDLYVTDDISVQDALNVSGLATFSGGKVGYVVEVARNADTVALEQGDLVVIAGVDTPVIGNIPVITVRRATTSEAHAVIGVVDQHYIPARALETDDPAGKSESAVVVEAVEPGEYLTIVTLGAFSVVKVDASYGPIAVGDLLVASPNPGYAMRTDAPKAGTLIGKALAGLESGQGVIPLVVLLP